jgi:GntR family transcriptional regulator/MocR family aminotransferase
VQPDGSVPSGARLTAEGYRTSVSGGQHVVELADALPAAVVPGGTVGPVPTESLVVGGFCELFGPSFNLGYALLPPGLAEAVSHRIEERGEQPPFVTQLAAEALLRTGTARRLAHRLHRRYATSSELVSSALAVHAARGTAVARVDDAVHADQLAAELLAHGIRVRTLRSYYFSGRPVPGGVVFGYGHVPEALLRRVLPVLGRVLGSRTPAQHRQGSCR